MPIRHSSTKIWKIQSGTKTTLRHPARACRTWSRSRDDMLAEDPESAGKTRRRDLIYPNTHSRAVPVPCVRRGRAAQMFTRDSRSDGPGHDPAEKTQGGGRESGEFVRLKSHCSSSASRRRAQKASASFTMRAVPATEKRKPGS